MPGGLFVNVEHLVIAWREMGYNQNPGRAGVTALFPHILTRIFSRLLAPSMITDAPIFRVS